MEDRVEFNQFPLDVIEAIRHIIEGSIQELSLSAKNNEVFIEDKFIFNLQRYILSLLEMEENIHRHELKELQSELAKAKEENELLQAKIQYWEDLQKETFDDCKTIQETRMTVVTLRKEIKTLRTTLELYEKDDRQSILESLYEENKTLKDTKAQAYWERNQLVSFLSRCFHSYLGRHPEDDKDWEDDWRNIVFIDSPRGQLSWHIHDSELKYFTHLEKKNIQWDGHTTQEKYERLEHCPSPKAEKDKVVGEMIDCFHNALLMSPMLIDNKAWYGIPLECLNMLEDELKQKYLPKEGE